MLLMCYVRSAFRDFQSYLRVLVGLDEDDVQLILKQLDLNFNTYEMLMKVFEKSFSNTFLVFTPYWNYKPTNAVHTDSPLVYTCDKISYLCTIDRNLLKCDVTDGSVVNRIR